MLHSAVLFACLALPAAAIAQERSGQSLTVEYEGVAGAAAHDDREQLAYRYDNAARMTVHVQVGGEGPFDFLVDTGADRTVVSSSVAGRLRLGRTEGALMHSATGRNFVHTAAIDTIQFSNKTVRNVQAAVLDGRNIGADGILGIDSLRSERVTFDFRKQRMTIVPSVAKLEKLEGDEIVVRGKLRAGRLVLTRATAGGRRINVVVDTGAELSIGNQALLRSLRGKGLLKPVGKIHMRSVTGELLSGEVMELKRLEVGGVNVEDLTIVFAEAHTFRTLKLRDKPALLMGMNTLKAFDRVSIDFANRKFRIVLPEEAQLQTFRLASLLDRTVSR